jgi:hypothetical protein
VKSVLVIISGHITHSPLHGNTVLLIINFSHQLSILFTFHHHKIMLNAAVEWLTLLLHIREVPRSNLDLEMAYPD